MTRAKIGREGLLNVDRDELRKIKTRGVRAARLALRNAPNVHYSQAPDRWEGIAHKLHADKGQYPLHADCSSFATWVLWNATLDYALPDWINHENWAAGDTGSMQHGGRKVSLGDLRILDLIFYGNEGWRPGHVAVYVGQGMVISHGSEGGPYYLPVRYRKDVAIGGWAPRRYLH